MQIQLRPYQQEAVDAFFDAMPAHRRQLIVLPTGAGKTVVFGAIARRYFEQVDSSAPILIMAHRTELLDQAEQKMQLVWPRVFTGRIQAGRNEQLAEVLFASTQTLVAGRAIRQPGLIIYDEAHHSQAAGAAKVLERLGAFDPDGPPLLGVTATPSMRGLGDIFEHVTYERTILQMIMDGYLANARGKRVDVPGLDLKTMRMTGGDYNAKDLSTALNGVQALDAVVDAVLEHAAERKSIVFAVDVKHGKALARRFQQAGVDSASIDGQMPPQERANILQSFSQDRLRVLVNCQVLTEGYDEPSVDTVVIARPTRSSILYTQMVGRGLRLHPGKEDALILDLTGASDDKSLQTFARLMKSQKKKPIEVAMEKGNEINEDPDDVTMNEDESVEDWIRRMDTVKREKRERTAKTEAVAHAINLFANRSRYRWQRVVNKQHTKEAFAISFGDSRWAYLYRDGNEFWPVLELAPDKETGKERFMPLHDRALPLEYAQGVAEGFLELFESKLIQKEADWQNAPVSPRQKHILDAYHIRYDDTWTMGMASDALGKVFAKKRVKILAERFVPQKWIDFLETEKGKQWLDFQIDKMRKFATATSKPLQKQA